MRIYISGGMSKYSEGEITRRFGVAENVLKKEGYKVFNPARWRWFLRYVPYKVALVFDICMLALCDRIYMLDGWIDSPGATAEKTFADAVGMVKVYER